LCRVQEFGCLGFKDSGPGPCGHETRGGDAGGVLRAPRPRARSAQVGQTTHVRTVLSKDAEMSVRPAIVQHGRGVSR